MKINILFMSACLLFMASACSVNKRAHRPGYNVEWYSKNPKPEKHQKVKEQVFDDSVQNSSIESTISIEFEEKTLDQESLTEEITMAGANSSIEINNLLDFRILNRKSGQRLTNENRMVLMSEKPQNEDLDPEKLALTGFWLSLLGLIFIPLAAFLVYGVGIWAVILIPAVLIILGIINSSIALNLMRKNPAAYKNKKLAVAGLILGIIGVLVFLYFSLLLLFELGSAV